METAQAVRGRTDAPVPSHATPGRAEPFLSQVTHSFLLFCVVLVENSLLPGCRSFILFNLASLLVSLSSKPMGTDGSY